MTRETTQSIVKVARVLRQIANAYGIVFETSLIESDLERYIQETIELANAMRGEKSFFNYSKTLWIRKQGVESSEERAKYFGGIVATITIEFDKEFKLYTITHTRLNRSARFFHE